MASSSFRPREEGALNIAPLNSMPYVDPHKSDGNNISSQPRGYMRPTGDPALVYFPNKPVGEKLDQVLSVTHNAVVLSGGAATGALGPVIGKMNVLESTYTYLFRVSLPGVTEDGYSCNVTPEGTVSIKGVTTTGEKFVYKSCMTFEMQTQNLSPPGHFSISFKLPGPVAPESLTSCFGIDGLLEGIVKKQAPSM